MTKTVKIDVVKEDYFKVREIISIYTNHRVAILVKEQTNEITFNCSVFKVNRLKHDIDLAMKLGIEMKMAIV